MIKLVEAMPEPFYDEKPAEGMKSFRSQVSHITTWLRTHSQFVTGIEMEKINGKSKEEFLSMLNSFFEEFITFLNQVETPILEEKVKIWYGTVSKESVLLTMDNHLSHHRGQMVVYLRLKGIKPPSYIGW